MEKQQITGNEPAMPATDGDSFYNKGLSIRQQFAMAAMQGILAKESWAERILSEHDQSFAKEIAAASVVMADTLITELNK